MHIFSIFKKLFCCKLVTFIPASTGYYRPMCNFFTNLCTRFFYSVFARWSILNVFGSVKLVVISNENQCGWLHANNVLYTVVYRMYAYISYLSFGFAIGVRHRGAEPSLHEKLVDSARKTAMLTCKITLRDSPHPVIISKKSRISGTLSRSTE